MRKAGTGFTPARPPLLALVHQLSLYFAADLVSFMMPLQGRATISQRYIT